MAGWVMTSGAYRRPSITEPRAITFKAKRSSTTDLTTYTFNTNDIGAASASRLVVVAGHGDAAAGITLTGITINAVSATLIDQGGSANSRTVIGYLLVPSGTNADIEISWTGSPGRCAIGIWTITGTSATPIDTDIPAISTSTAHTVTVDLPTNSVGIAAYTHATGGVIGVWDLGFEEYNDNIEVGGSQVSAVTLTGTGANGVTITDTSTSVSAQLIAAVWA